jgi:hypothetical protein
MVTATAIFAAIGIGSILWRWRRLSGTTLRAPAAWAVLVFALLPLAAYTMHGGNGNTPLFAGAEGIRLMIAMATFCPAMAVLGAKRPQDVAWQFIVISLWLVLAIPGVRAALLADGSPATLHGAPSWFLMVLWGVSAMNYLPTRYAISGLLVALGQLVLIFEYLPLASIWPDLPWLRHNAIPFGASLLTAAAFIACVGRFARRPTEQPLDRLWIDFRNWYGAVWGLRCQQRINQSAEMYGWPVRLEWHGFATNGTNPIAAELERALENHFNNLLRRFVSPAWIAERLGAG